MVATYQSLTLDSFKAGLYTMHTYRNKDGALALDKITKEAATRFLNDPTFVRPRPRSDIEQTKIENYIESLPDE